MITATCIDTITTDNKITAYKIQKPNGEDTILSAEKLKLLMKNGKIKVVNLIIQNDQILENPYYEEESMIAKMCAMGYDPGIDTICGHKYYVINLSPEQVTVFIPDDVTDLTEKDAVYENGICPSPSFNTISCDKLIVIGGKNLTNAAGMFQFCLAKSIDLSKFHTSKITNMDCMFCSCQTKDLDLSHFDTSNVTCMKSMFFWCKTEKLDLSRFDTSNVTCMADMFFDCDAKEINVSSFDTSNVTDMSNMFTRSKTEKLDLDHFDTKRVVTMYGMFTECSAKQINISGMTIDSDLVNIKNMFRHCNAEIKASDKRILKQIARKDG